MLSCENLMLQLIEKDHVYYEIDDIENPDVSSRIRILFDQTKPKNKPEISCINPIEIYDEENEIDIPTNYIYSDAEIKLLKEMALKDYYKYIIEEAEQD